MGFPELDSNEPVIILAHNIKVKSVVFEAVLTNKRLILVDEKKGLVPPQEIRVNTINTVEGGENAIRDPILTFTIMSYEGNARQMILTFPRMASGERRRERDDWLKALTALITSPDIVPAPSGSDQIPYQNPVISPASPAAGSRNSFQKKKVEIARPRRNIIESVPAMPRPVETSSLPVGTFCSRCGNRVPPESVFCNRCGTPVVNSAEQPDVSVGNIPLSTEPAVSAVPQVQVPTLPVFGQGGDRKERTLEEVIHSIEPLIEDSKPRSGEPVPLVPRQYPAPPPASEIPEAEPPASEIPVADPATEPSPAEAGPAATPPQPPQLSPVPATPPKRPKTVMIAGLVIAVLVVIGGMVLLANSWQTTPPGTVITQAVTAIPTTAVATPAPVASPLPTVTRIIIPTPAPKPDTLIPKTGVWLRIIYFGTYSGTFGTPGSQFPVGEKNTGDNLYTVSTINGPVVASIQKMDGSSGTLTIELYKNGELIKRSTTVSPKGIIDFQADLKPKPTPTPLPSQTVFPTITPV